MGTYVNPGNNGFAVIRNGKYIDKSGMIALINDTINTRQKLICVSRPRRFGKSYAAQMLCAYYDRTCDSAALFDDLEIANDPAYPAYRNKFDVIYLDITGFISQRRAKGQDIDGIPGDIADCVTRELLQEYPGIRADSSLGNTLVQAVRKSGIPFIIIIDEWDALFREAEDRKEAQVAYINLLRELFKNGNVTDTAIAAAYMTGILPIKKYGTQSAISDFREFTMVKPRKFARYVGFTGEEVRNMCAESGMDYARMKEWYDGYSLGGIRSIYSPNSVMQAIENRDFDSYWSGSETYESLRQYIDSDFEGLQQDIIQMMGDVSLPVNTSSFQNDMTTIKGKDDVLTLLVHLGYLAYDEADETVRIPNEEVRVQFVDAVRHSDHLETARLIQESDKLLHSTIRMDAEAVAKTVDAIHNSYVAPLFYNDEQALRSVVKIAYISAINQYVRIEEMPSGKGYADIVYIPRRKSVYPALVIELKADGTSAPGAIEQIHKKNYPSVLMHFGGSVLLVGISYDKEKRHRCAIELLSSRGS